MFKAVDIKIGFENVTKEVDNYYGYKCLLDMISSGKTDDQKSEFESLLYTKDENEGINVLDPYTELNAGLLWWSKLASGSKLLEMNMRLFCYLGENTDHHRYIINQVRLEFTFRRQTSLFYILCAEDNVELMFEIQECNLHVWHVVVPPQTIVSHTTTLAKDKPAKYPIQRLFLKVFSIPQAALHWQGESLFGNRIPNIMYVVLMKTRDLHGDKKGNPHTFYHHNISPIAFYGDNRPIGGEVLEMLDFAGNDTNFLDAYARLFSIDGCEPDITRDDFRLGYTIFVYKSETNIRNTLSLEQRGHTRLEINWIAKLAVTNRMYLSRVLFKPIGRIDCNHL